MEIDEIRNQIDLIDSEIVRLLADRLSLIPGVVKYKREKNIPMYVPEREKEILQRILRISKEKNLREEYVKDIFQRIIQESHNYAEKIKEKK